ncbi:hypothetical protein L6164_035781 [Bauhinia variegata]|uniref:Uncharacterized protein n=1 Tax=Bauhinia variegata TaxID=167791 RepID=A0ACB9KF28_BAUVA|nr:hypothetical protein L6164_035781 [Bauhinia variegata]
MKTTRQTWVTLIFALILIHIIICSLVSLNRETRSNLVDNDSPRKLIAYGSSDSTSLQKLKAANAARHRSAGTSLRKAPPTKSNPSHNK